MCMQRHLQISIVTSHKTLKLSTKLISDLLILDTNGCILMFWEVGKHIGSVLLGGERAEYGKRIVVPLAQQLQAVTVFIKMFMKS